MDYGSEPLAIMVGQYLRETLQAYMWIDEFISDQIYQHPDVALNKILYLFENRSLRKEVKPLNQKVEGQSG